MRVRVRRKLSVPQIVGEGDVLGTPFFILCLALYLHASHEDRTLQKTK